MSPSAALAMKEEGIRLPDPSKATASLVGKAYLSSSGADWELIGTMDAHLLPECGFTASTLRDSKKMTLAR
jgi:hypothetical protein